MDNEILSNDLVIKGNYYPGNHLPKQISNAIYQFGSFETFDILGFIDTSDNLDGSRGMIITPQEIYFKFGQQGKFKYNEITKLSLEKHHQNNNCKIIITTRHTSYAFSNKTINPEILLKWLQEVTTLQVDLIMTAHEQIAYYVNIVLTDIKNDVYEDTILTYGQQCQLDDFFKELILVNNLDEENYCYELENICRRALTFFEELELDSEEIDTLIAIETKLNEQEVVQDQQVDTAKKYYEEMMDKYHQGDTTMYEQAKGMMERFGITEADLAGKSSEEIEDFLCQKFGISKGLFEKIANKFKGV